MSDERGSAKSFSSLLLPAPRCRRMSASAYRRQQMVVHVRLCAGHKLELSILEDSNGVIGDDEDVVVWRAPAKPVTKAEVMVAASTEGYDVETDHLPLEPRKTYFALVEPDEPQQFVEFVPIDLPSDSVRSQSTNYSVAEFESTSRERC